LFSWRHSRAFPMFHIMWECLESRRLACAKKCQMRVDQGFVPFWIPSHSRILQPSTVVHLVTDCNRQDGEVQRHTISLSSISPRSDRSRNAMF
jgi:hypothetical protein